MTSLSLQPWRLEPFQHSYLFRFALSTAPRPRKASQPVGVQAQSALATAAREHMLFEIERKIFS
jgi:hypothetical protein